MGGGEDGELEIRGSKYIYISRFESTVRLVWGVISRHCEGAETELRVKEVESFGLGS